MKGNIAGEVDAGVQELWQYFEKVSDHGGLVCRLCNFVTRISSSQQPLFKRLREHLQNEHQIFTFSIGNSLNGGPKIRMLQHLKRMGKNRQYNCQSQNKTRHGPQMNRYNTMLMKSTSNLAKKEQRGRQHGGLLVKRNCKKDLLRYFTQSIDLDQFNDQESPGHRSLNLIKSNPLVSVGRNRSIVTEPFKQWTCYSADQIEAIMEGLQKITWSRYQPSSSISQQ